METHLDLFDVVSYAESDGTRAWPGIWVEDPPPSIPTSGNLLILADNGIATPPSTAQLLLRNGATLTRPIDLSGASSASIEVHYRRHGLSGFVLIQSTVDGSTWADAISIVDAGTDAAYQVGSAAIPVASTSIRFLHQPGGLLWVDQVAVQIETAAEDPQVSSGADGSAGVATARRRRQSTAVAASSHQGVAQASRRRRSVAIASESSGGQAVAGRRRGAVATGSDGSSGRVLLAAERPRPQIFVSGALQRTFEVQGALQRTIEVKGAF